MKKLTLIGVLLAACAGNCFATLGDTKAQMIRNYGQKLGDGVLLGKPCFYFTTANLIITAVFDDNKSVCEMTVLSIGRMHSTAPEALGSLMEMTATNNWKSAKDWQVDQKSPPDITRWLSKRGFVGLRTREASGNETIVAMTEAFDRDIYQRAPAGSAETENRRLVAPLGLIAHQQTRAWSPDMLFKYCYKYASAGNAWPQFFLGQLYLEGRGCEVNTNEAKLWFKKAADQGNDSARKQLEKLQ